VTAGTALAEPALPATRRQTRSSTAGGRENVLKPVLPGCWGMLVLVMLALLPAVMPF